jgi:hypothetical protein
LKVYILAVTLAYDKYCIAGMDEDGNWVRPIPKDPATRFWRKDQITFNQGYGFIRSGDVIEFQERKPLSYQHQNHTEDFIVDSSSIKLVKRLSNPELMGFLKDKSETQKDFDNTTQASGRSLCLIKVDHFNHQITQFPGARAKPKMTFLNQHFNVANPKTTQGNYIVKDCKWSNLVLNNSVRNESKYNNIYLSIGLATPTGYDGIEYPQVIGLHTDPEIPLPNSYPF